MKLINLKSYLAKGLSFFPAFILKHATDLLVKSYSKKTNTFITFCKRPIDKSGFKNLVSDNSNNEVGIIVQGPFVTDSDFTLQTLLMYRKLYPLLPIVLSTWSGEIDEYARSILKSNRVDVIENSKPQFIGFLNLNLQLRSTNFGIEFLKLQYPHLKKVLKTRTDQRIYTPRIFHFFEGLLKLFGDNKLIALGFNSKINKFGSISDMMIFGSFDQVARYFSLPEEQVSVTKSDYLKAETGLYLNPEQLLFQNFAGDLPKTASIYAQMTVNHFILIDKEMIDLYWHKYTSLENKNCYNSEYSDMSWSFAEYTHAFEKHSR